MAQERPKMSLESVELLMRVEEQFGVSIPDEDSERLAVVGDLHFWLCQELLFTKTQAPSPGEVWSELQHLIADQLDLPLEAIRTDSHFVHDLRVQ